MSYNASHPFSSKTSRSMSLPSLLMSRIDESSPELTPSSNQHQQQFHHFPHSPSHHHQQQQQQHHQQSSQQQQEEQKHQPQCPNISQHTATTTANSTGSMQHFLRKVRRKQSFPQLTKSMIPVALSVMALLWATCTLFLTLNWERLHVKQIPPALENNFEHLRGKKPKNIPSNIPLPLPKQKVSVVLMNFSRPRMIRQSSLMQTFLAHPNVDEVLLLHASPKTAFEYVHPKVVNIDATQHNDEMGLSLRFYFCQLAKNDWVIHADDDVEFPTTALNEMLIEFGRNPKRIVGRFGRDMVPNNSFDGYSSTNTHKSTEVMLTRLMVMERNICPAFFTYAHLIWDDVVLYSGEGPMWNGEDIFMSLVANHVYRGYDDTTTTNSDNNNNNEEKKDAVSTPRKNNYAMDWLDVYSAPNSLKDYDNGKLDISGGMAGFRFWSWQWWQSVFRRNRHYSYRGQLWKTARQRLADLPRNIDDLYQRQRR